MRHLLRISPWGLALSIWMLLLLGGVLLHFTPPSATDRFVVERALGVGLLVLLLGGLALRARWYRYLQDAELARLRANLALRAREEELGAWFEAADAGAGIVDGELRIRRANVALATLMSLAPGEDCAGKTLAEAMPRMAASLEHGVRRVLESGMAVRDVEVCEGSNDEGGCARHWLATLFPIPPGDGAATVGIVLVDISERKKLAGLLAFHSRILHEEATGVMLVRAADGIILYVNPAFAQLFGYGAGEMCGRPVSMLNAPGEQSAEDVAADIARCLTEQGEWLGPVENIRRDGSRFWTAAKVAVFQHPEHGDVWVTNQWDITGQRERERALRKAADEVEDLYQRTPCGYHSCDNDGLIVRINDTELEWLGYRREEVVGKMHRSQLLSPDCREACQEAFEAFKQSGHIANLEMEMQRKDGSRFPVLLSASAIHDAEGRFLRSRAMVLDISMQKRLEQARERERELQRQHVEELARCLVSVQEEERRQLSNQLHDQVSANLATLALKLGMMKAQLPNSSPEILSLSADLKQVFRETNLVVREVCANLRPALLDFVGLQAALEAYGTQYAERSGIQVAMEIRWWTNGEESTLETQVFRIIQEALANIAEHAGASRAWLVLKRTDQESEIDVVDDGVGFERGPAEGGEEGLGLEGMRQRAAFMGGSFCLMTRPGMGTHIRVRIPNSAVPQANTNLAGKGDGLALAPAGGL